ncbi:hypothetical protein DM01DRAFT_1096073 [Hesseltinella vesiculosa]|uniref:Uncharacterized protein n=1 Tax=Hesseltinella vesiculosa TaxID=101127 RepID=A0A1X2GCG6_9FUNG|nr:hypothetical protein DM01DRAFT_1096073 [Hesseltinella vesiculosa]
MSCSIVTDLVCEGDHFLLKKTTNCADLDLKQPCHGKSRLQDVTCSSLDKRTRGEGIWRGEARSLPGRERWLGGPRKRGDLWL